MSASHGGKGDSPRPVNPKQYGENFDRIFRKPEDPRLKLIEASRETHKWIGATIKEINEHPFKRLGFTPQKAIEYLEKAKPNP